MGIAFHYMSSMHNSTCLQGKGTSLFFLQHSALVKCWFKNWPESSVLKYTRPKTMRKVIGYICIFIILYIDLDVKIIWRFQGGSVYMFQGSWPRAPKRSKSSSPIPRYTHLKFTYIYTYIYI